ncbi:MAG: hypothetical protein AMXMBFR33_61640 [Candidatus Xenobia bacterium]
MALFSLLSAVLFLALKMGSDAWRRMDAQYDTQRSLRQAENVLLTDLKQTSSARLNFKKISSSPGNGDVLWFLSAQDPAAVGPNSEKFVRTTEAEPDWQRTILYYCIRPSNHNTLAGFACGIDANPNGDAFCPHKFLIRKVINLPATPETLMAPGAVDAYTTAPAGFDINSFAGEPGLESARIISDKFLWFEANRAAGSRLVTVDMRSFRLAEARRKISVGSNSLLNSRFTVHHQLRVLPQNR